MSACKSIAIGVVLCWASLHSSLADDWPQWRGPLRDGVWRETGVVEKFDAPQLPIQWRAEIGPGYSGPTVAAGRVYVTDRQVEPAQVERVHCFNAATGKPLWHHTYDCPYVGVGYAAGPRAAVTIDQDKAYSLGAMGNLFCFNAATGDVLWQKDLKALYNIKMPMWGIAAAPLIDGQRLILNVGGEHACVVALDKTTGEEIWKALDDPAQYSAPILIQQAGRPVLVIWTGAGVVGLNPADGSVYWREEMKPKQMPIGIATPVVAGDLLFVSSFYDGSLMLRLKTDSATARPAVERVWRKVGPDEIHTQSLHCMIGTPILENGYVYGVDSFGQLRCLDAATGERIWESQDAVPKARWAAIHMIRHDDKVWMFNERGELLITRLSPTGFEEISRTKLIEPTTGQLDQRGGVCWSHPAFANRHVFARNDQELVCASLAAQN
ncbi:MAG TPA: PQQ-binding-like beta-propeller repeat protein [Pirellulales bacterium]|jgi:outer membrane protein assembly factor BamB|nr:PQQ-binding-like beta-propeller repeat protein [Pirellulales bacterium]